MVQAIVDGMPAKTGKTAEQWVEVLKKDGPEGHKAQVDWLKIEHGLGHMQASLVAEFLKHGGNVYADGDRLIDKLFSGKSAPIRPLYDRLAKEITALGSDVKMWPAQTMVASRRNKKFAEARPGKGVLEIRLALPDRPAKKDAKTGVVERMNVTGRLLQPGTF